MKIRLNKVQKELNIGLNTIVEFLQKKGIDIKEDPNAVVPEKGYELLMEAFSAYNRTSSPKSVRTKSVPKLQQSPRRLLLRRSP